MIGRSLVPFALAAVLFVEHASAQTPAVINGTLQQHAASATVQQEIAAIMARTTGPAWVGYAVPVAASRRQAGCWSVDGASGNTRVGPLKLEGPESLFILSRIEDRRVQRVLVASPECPIDAGGLTVHWLTGVRPADSLDWLSSLITAESPRRVSNSATVAIALHDGPQAADRLIALARTSPDRNIRGHALFWVAQRAGDKAAGAITDALDDPDTDLRRRAVFALSQLPTEEGIPRLIDLARTHRDAAVRRQAMFWLGQSRDPRALAFFEQVLKN